MINALKKPQKEEPLKVRNSKPYGYFRATTPISIKRPDMEIQSKKYKTGLVVGKFSPLHIGHEYLIEKAIDLCEKVVILSYSNPTFDKCKPEQVLGWLSKYKARIIVLENKKGFVPPNDASDDLHRSFVAEILKINDISDIDGVFTSEEYGDGFAEHLSKIFKKKIKHEMVDLFRKKHPISATKIRNDPHAHRKFLSPEVYKDFAMKIVFLGGESTGKSTLVKYFNSLPDCIGVNEYGRELWEENNGVLVYNDMLSIALEQTRRENTAMRSLKRYIFCDTTVLTTSMYSEHMFGKVHHRLKRLANISVGSKRPDYIFLCAPDFEFVQDGTRMSSDYRMKQHEWYIDNLKPHFLSGTKLIKHYEKKPRYILLTGSIDERISKVYETIGLVHK